MIPGIVPGGAAAMLPQTLQFARSDYNGGYSANVTVTINIKALFPFIMAGEDLRLDALYWSGGFCEGWKDRVAYFFKFGTAYSVALSGGGSKNHVISFVYGGGDTASMQHYYTGDSTSFPEAEVSLDRLTYFGTSGQANSYQKNLAA